MTDCDVLVIGAGIAGASAGWAAAEHARVILLERESAPGYHSTGRSAAIYTETYGNRVIRGLTVATGPFLRDPPPGFADHALLSPRGVLLIATEDQHPLIEREHRMAMELGAAIRLLDGEAARRIVPVLRGDYVASALHEPDAADMDVHAIHRGFLRGLHARGGRLVTGAEVTALERRRGLWSVRTAAGDFVAPLLVNAAGAWADALAGLAGLDRIGLVPRRRTALTFDPPDGVDNAAWPLCGDVGERFYFKPEAGRFLASPADETPSPPCDAQPEEIDLAVAVERIETATTMRVRRILRKWAGLRSFVADRTPVAGFDPRANGFFWLAGQGGYGIQTCTALAQCAAALLRGRDLPASVRDRGVSATDLAPGRLLWPPA
jgi:D-arginine dehydrogenase